MNPVLDDDYEQFKQLRSSCNNISKVYIAQLWSLVYESDHQNLYSKPMPWIRMYIALASLICVLAMVADLLHGLHNRKLWFPCRYFSLNAASLTVIAVAIKLPTDLTTLMPGNVDGGAKLGSLSFMCTIMANLLPSLATMDAKELVSNMIALGILVITLVVNVCVQVNAGEVIAAIYAGMLLMLLIIYVCSSLAIMKSKEILESKYQDAHQKASNDLDSELQQPGKLNVERLKQHVSNYWIMAGTGSPQFMTVCSATTSTSGVICALSTALHIFIVAYMIRNMKDAYTGYKWSMSVILILQFIGVLLGTLAPLSRCFAALSLSFKLSRKWIWRHIKVFQVESYWTQKLSDWKRRSIPFPFGSRKGKIVIEKLKVLFLSICIRFQKTVVVACKMIAVIPLLLVICVLHCKRHWKWLKARFGVSGPVLLQSPEKTGKYKDLKRYVMQLQDDMEFPERTLKGISKSVNHVIQKAEKQQPNNLMMLLTQPRGFKGLEKFDSHDVPSLLSELDLNCWSLPLVTLTAIAISLPNIQKSIVDCLLSSVSEGFRYVTLVEESLDATDDQRSNQKVAKTLWLEVEVYHEWLGNKLPKPANANTVGEVLQWLRDASNNMVTKEKRKSDLGVSSDDSKYRSIAASSMYCITETLIHSYHARSQEELFVQLSLMIADILVACLTNLPQVIAMKCHAVEIEKREESVHVAAQLLGETTQIINTLQNSQEELA